jgi:DNA-directed RNA polymerase subunit RPC12/RpoP
MLEMKINCLSCGHSLDFDEAYSDQYDGEVKCWVCGGRLALRTERGHIRSVRLIEATSNHSASGDQEKRDSGNQAPQTVSSAQERK